MFEEEKEYEEELKEKTEFCKSLKEKYEIKEECLHRLITALRDRTTGYRFLLEKLIVEQETLKENTKGEPYHYNDVWFNNVFAMFTKEYTNTMNKLKERYKEVERLHSLIEQQKGE